MSILLPLGEDVYYAVELPPTRYRVFKTARVANPARFFAGERELRKGAQITVYATKAEWEAARAKQI